MLINYYPIHAQLELEIDLILGKKDVAKNAAAEWVSKWTPAILACAQGMRGKAAQSAVQEAERKYGGIYG